MKSRHGDANAGIEVVFTDVFQQVGPLHTIAHGAFDLGKEQIDLIGAEITGQIAQYVCRADVQIGACSEVEQNGLRRRIAGGLRQDLRSSEAVRGAGQHRDIYELLRKRFNCASLASANLA